MEQKTISEILQTKSDQEIYDWNQRFINSVLKKDTNIKAFTFFDQKMWLKNLETTLENHPRNFSSLRGVPIGVKDIMNTIDMPTCMGSPIWADFTPGNDARVVHNFKFNGGIVAGKTVTAEFAVHTPNETRNPWNLNHSPGTSSSGSAAAVACGMVPLALGTQTAGSIIRPASYCGVYGFKPSFGTLPRTGMLKTTDTLDTVGLFSTNSSDAKLLFDAIRVKGLDYPFVNKFLENAKHQSKNGQNWKIGIISDQFNAYENYASYVIEAFQNISSELNNISEVELLKPKLPQLFNNAHVVQEQIYHKSLSYYFKKEFQNKTLISPVMYDIVNEGNKISKETYLDSIKKQDNLSEEIDQLFDEYDILITPSTAGSAPLFQTAIDPKDSCLIWTMCGLPVMNIPLFYDKGMPFGLQVIARKYCDYKLISFVEEMVDKDYFPKFSKIN